MLVNLAVLQEHWQERQRGDDPGGHDGQPSAGRPPPVHEPRQPGRDEDREEQQKVAVRQRQQDPRHAEHHEPPPRAARQVGVQAEERERHPLRGEDLDVRELAGTVRREAERQSGAHPRERRSGEAPSEQEREESRERVGEQETDVVRRDGVDAGELQRCGDQAQPEEVLGEGHGARHGPHHRRVPPRVGERRDLGVPPEDPDVEDGIARVVRDAGARAWPRPATSRRPRARRMRAGPRRALGSWLWALAGSCCCARLSLPRRSAFGARNTAVLNASERRTPRRRPTVRAPRLCRGRRRRAAASGAACAAAADRGSPRGTRTRRR